MVSKRDDFPQKIKELLAKRAGFRCSNPMCRRITIGANSNPQKSTNIGVASHISAAAQGGPRYNPKLTSEERMSIENAIWLCQTCSILIDKDPDKYTDDILKGWKVNAENESFMAVNTPTYMNINYENDNLFYDEEADFWSEDFDFKSEESNKRSSITCDITSLLAACRRTKSWDNRSELKLYSWLNEHSEEEVTLENIQELKIIRKNLIEYLQIHLDMDKQLMDVPIDNFVNEFNIYVYIEIHPALTSNEIAEANRINMKVLRGVLESMWKEGKIIPATLEDDPVSNFEGCRWMKNYDAID